MKKKKVWETLLKVHCFDWNRVVIEDVNEVSLTFKLLKVSGTTQEIKCPALRGKNFIIWHDRLELFLDSYEILEILSHEQSLAA